MRAEVLQERLQMEFGQKNTKEWKHLLFSIDESKRKRKILSDEILQWAIAFLELSSRFVENTRWQLNAESDQIEELEAYLQQAERKYTDIISWKEQKCRNILENEYLEQIESLEKEEEEYERMIERQRLHEQKKAVVKEWKFLKREELELDRQEKERALDVQKKIIRENAKKAMPRIHDRSKRLVEHKSYLKKKREQELIRVLPEITTDIHVER